MVSGYRSGVTAGCVDACTVVAGLVLVMVSLLSACSTPEEEDGTRASYKVAHALCKRMWACEETHALGHLWASVEHCASREAGRVGSPSYRQPPVTTTLGPLSVEALRVGCGPEADIALDGEALAPCLDALEKLTCDEALLRAYTHPTLPSACHGFFEAWATAENAWLNAKADGETCDDAATDHCGVDSRCVRIDWENWSTCQPRWPQEGNPCTGTQGPGDCGPRLFCVDGRCRRDPPGEGETCAFEEQCMPGLDCDADTRLCTRSFSAGDACDEADACGAWYVCVEGRCRPRLEAGSVGTACESAGDCTRSYCVDGTCRAAPDVGEACLLDCDGDGCGWPCRYPLVCQRGVCEDVPACGAGPEDAACSDDYQCVAGLVCLPDGTIDARGIRRLTCQAETEDESETKDESDTETSSTLSAPPLMSRP